MWNQYYYFDLPKIKVGRTRTTKNEVTLTNILLKPVGILYFYITEAVAGGVQ